MTYACSSCKFSLSPLQLTATPTAEVTKGLEQLEASRQVARSDADVCQEGPRLHSY